ncbi:MAG: transglycosylase domain-containing protein, partial [Candidatus Adiutrix sp.]
MLKTIIKRLFLLVIIALGLTFFLWQGLIFFPNPISEMRSWDWNVSVLDREGRLLKNFLSPKEEMRKQVALNDFNPLLIQAVLLAEDKRFYHHFGFDPLAIVRAAALNLRERRIVSGASTITMQLARLNMGLSPGPRTFKRKIKEFWWALLIERHHHKDEILVKYLNKVPCGNLTVGFPAAAKLYLGQSVGNLSAAEAAFLAALPVSPGAFNPYKNPKPALTRRDKILKRM